MRKLLLSGASAALFSMGALSLPSLADNGLSTGSTGATTIDTVSGDDSQTPTDQSNDRVPAGTAAGERGANDAAADGDATDEEAVDAYPSGTSYAATYETLAINQLLDADVIDVSGEHVASVEDLLFAPGGNLTHVVVSYGGFFGIGTKEVLIPWNQVSYSVTQDTLQIPGTEADLIAAPAYMSRAELLEQQQADRLARQAPVQPTTPSEASSAPQKAQTPIPE